jgi:hypothetical protein
MVPLGLPPIPIEASEDNMVRCQKTGIPSGLGAAAQALGFPPELQKLDGRHRSRDVAATRTSR